MTNLNNIITNFANTLTINDFEAVDSFNSLGEALTSINLSTTDSGFYTPKTIKLNDLVFTTRQNRQINLENIIVIENNIFKTLNLKISKYNEFERFVSENL